MFQVFPELIHDADQRHRVSKHCPFAEREVLIGGKLLACNIRKLPSLVLSWAHHVNYRGHKGNPVAMWSPHQMAESSIADDWLSEMTDDGRFQIDRWLRWEYLADDFIDFISMFTAVSDEQKDRVLGIGRINQLHYDHNVSHWFSDDQIESLYEHNPIWASAEEEAYRPSDALHGAGSG